MRESSNFTRGPLHWIRCPFQIVRHLEREKEGGQVADLRVCRLSAGAETPLGTESPLCLTGAFGLEGIS